VLDEDVRHRCEAGGEAQGRSAVVDAVREHHGEPLLGGRTLKLPCGELDRSVDVGTSSGLDAQEFTDEDNQVDSRLPRAK
jgi:hypothetical protein